MNTIRILAIGIALLFIQACSHPIEIEGQGGVTSTSTRGCSYEDFIAVPKPDNCAKNLVVGDYLETYYPTAKAGWKFDKWVNYCTTATPPNYECSFNFSAATVKQFWFQTMPPLKAVFTPLPGTPITDTVTVNGVEWAQVDLFLGTRGIDLYTVCPTGVCAGNLNGYDMTGWVWASEEDVRELFQYLIGCSNCLVIENPYGGDGWGSGMFNAGFRWTGDQWGQTPGYFVNGLMYDHADLPHPILPGSTANFDAAVWFGCTPDQPFEPGTCGTTNTGSVITGWPVYPRADSVPNLGAWLHR